MKRLSNRGFAAMTLLSIILPVSLLISFRMSGIIPEPQKPQEILLQPVCWNMSRPADIVTVDDLVGNSYADDIISINMNVHIGEYIKNKLDWPSDGDADVVDLKIVATADVSSGFIYSFVVRFSELNANEILYIELTPTLMNLINLKKGLVGESSKYRGGAFFEAEGLNQPRNASLSILSYWVLQDQDSVDHAITVTLETTYFNGTTYLKVVLPIQLNVLLDAGDSFESAKIIRTYTQPNESLGAGDDFEDYYSVLVDVVEPIKFEVCMIPSSNVDFDLYLYNQNRELIANSTSRGQGVIERLIVIFDSGWWYIRVSDPIKLGENGTYTLTIKYFK